MLGYAGGEALPEVVNVAAEFVSVPEFVECSMLSPEGEAGHTHAIAIAINIRMHILYISSTTCY